MIEEGYAWEYDGGAKNKNFEELKRIRRSKGTMPSVSGAIKAEMKATDFIP